MARSPHDKSEDLRSYPTDLSKYFIAKKFQHGWLMQEQKGDKTIFIPREHLAKMGYIRKETVQQKRNSWGRSGAIVVPTGRVRQRSRSCCEESKSVPSEAISIPNAEQSEESLPRSCPEEKNSYEVTLSDLFAGDLFLRTSTDKL